MIDPTQIEYPLVPLYSLSYDSETAHIPLSLPEVSTLQHMCIPSKYPTPSMLHPHAIGRGTAIHMAAYSSVISENGRFIRCIRKIKN